MNHSGSTMTIIMNVRSGMITLCVLVLLLSEAECGICQVSRCTECTIQRAMCATTSSDEPIPQNLSANTREIRISYTGPDVELNAAMFERFKNCLSVIFFEGNFRAVQAGAFANLQNLTNISFYKASLAIFSDDSFGNKSSLMNLTLVGTKMFQVPTNIFHSLPNLQTLDLSYNNLMLVCTDQITSIGDEFRLLLSLRSLKLDGLGHYNNNACQKISRSYFEPTKQVTKLSLSKSAFFVGTNRAQLLRPLVKLRNLTMNEISPYKECPSRAVDLFNNLSYNQDLYYLKMNDWKTSFAVNESCFVTAETLSGLKQLRNLTSLNFRYSDKIFGNQINRHLFEGFQSLKYLDLGWCRFDGISTGAFEGLNLKRLDMGSNQLGTREFWPYGLDGRNLTSNVEYLNMVQCGIDAIDNYAYFIAKTFPRLKTLDLSRNRLHFLPRFTKAGHITPIWQVTKLLLNDNNMESMAEDHMAHICNIMPQLKSLNAYGNKITLLSELCLSLTELHLENNRLKTELVRNFQAIHMLENLKYLNLGQNKIDRIPNNSFSNMKQLQYIYLQNNDLSNLDHELLFSNANLKVIDLSVNKISIFNTTLFDRSPNLQRFHLSDNLITQLGREFVEFVNRSQEPAGRLSKVILEGNPFDCSCGQEYFKNWVHDTDILQNAKNLTCNTPDNLRTQQIYCYQYNYFECQVKQYLIWAAVVAATVLLVVITAIPCYRYRWYLSHIKVVCRAVRDKAVDIKLLDECKYDAMICFHMDSDSDLTFVKQLLIEVEGGDYPMMNESNPDDRRNRVYLQARDAHIGGYRFETLCEVMRQSRKIIIVLSNSFLESSDCLREAAFAGEELCGSTTYKPDRIIVLVLEELNEDLLLDSTVTGLLTQTVIDLPESMRGNERKMSSMWRRLNRFVENRPSMVYQRRNRSRSRATRNGYQAI